MRLEDHLREEACRRVPRDVAVQRPDARVVSVDLDHYVPEGLHHLHVATKRVGWLDWGCACIIPWAGGDDVHVHAVGVHRVWSIWRVR